MTPPEIKSYHFGKIQIDKNFYIKDVIILPERVIGGWWRKSGHLVLPEDLTEILNAGPELLIIGQGAYGRMEISPDTKILLNNSGIQFIALQTKEACELYNQVYQVRRVVAALHLTC